MAQRWLDVHQGGERDPVTGNYLACGVTREEIEDNLAPRVCNPITGPHKRALIALYREIREAARFREYYRDTKKRHDAERPRSEYHDAQAAYNDAMERQCAIAEAEFRNSFLALQGEPDPRQTLAQAISKL